MSRRTIYNTRSKPLSNRNSDLKQINDGFNDAIFRQFMDFEIHVVLKFRFALLETKLPEEINDYDPVMPKETRVSCECDLL